MKPLFCIVGETGSGKDTVVDYICNKHPMTSKLCKAVVSYTNRPMRVGEVNGREHYFVSNEEFQKIKNENSRSVMAYTHIKKDDNSEGYEYMALRSELYNGANIYVIDPKGIQTLKKTPLYDYQLHIIFIDVPKDVRMNRALNKRHDAMINLLNRIEAEEEQFETFREEENYDVKFGNPDGPFEVNMQPIIKYILQTLYDYTFEDAAWEKGDMSESVQFLALFRGNRLDLETHRLYFLKITKVDEGGFFVYVFSEKGDPKEILKIYYPNDFDVFKDWNYKIEPKNNDFVIIKQKEYKKKHLEESLNLLSDAEELIKFPYRNVPHMITKLNRMFVMFRDLTEEKLEEY